MAVNKRNITSQYGVLYLINVTKTELKQDILSGDVFVFVNRRRTHIELLTWEKDGRPGASGTHGDR